MSSETSINNLLPPEVLSEMFLHCIPQDPLRHQQPDTTIAPMVLCHVCLSWRAIALRTPHLWKHLYHIGNANFSPWITPTFDSRDLTFLSWWMDNVKSVPIALRLEFKRNEKIERCPEQQGEYKGVDLNTFLEILGRLISNARQLHLDSQSLRYARRLRGFDCPRLDTIVLRGGGYWGSEVEYLLPVNPKQLLHRVSIENDSMGLTMDDLSSNLDFSLITHLHLKMQMTLDVWFSLLQQSVNLTHAWFSVGFDGSFDTPAPNGTILPHLQQLVFNTSHDVVSGRCFLEGVHLPSLVALSMHHFMPLDIEHLHRILSSTPNLRALQLTETVIHVDPDQQVSFFIDGDLDPTNPSLPGVVPYLSSLHFLYRRSKTDLFVPKNRDLAISALTGPWLQVGRPGNRLSTIFIGDIRNGLVQKTVRDEMNTTMVNFVNDIQSRLPPGVKLSVASLDDWHQKYMSQFEYLLLPLFNST